MTSQIKLSVPTWKHVHIILYTTVETCFIRTSRLSEVHQSTNRVRIYKKVMISSTQVCSRPHPPQVNTVQVQQKYNTNICFYCKYVVLGLTSPGHVSLFLTFTWWRRGNLRLTPLLLVSVCLIVLWDQSLDQSSQYHHSPSREQKIQFSPEDRKSFSGAHEGLRVFQNTCQNTSFYSENLTRYRQRPGESDYIRYNL